MAPPKNFGPFTSLLDLKRYLEFASGLQQGKECYNAESGVVFEGVHDCNMHICGNNYCFPGLSYGLLSIIASLMLLYLCCLIFPQCKSILSAEAKIESHYNQKRKLKHNENIQICEMSMLVFI